jgi:XapX domain-containing protein
MEKSSLHCQEDLQGQDPMKSLFISFAAGLFFGFLYGLIRVKSPAPPIVALLGLLGMVIGEQFGNSVITKKANAADAVSICAGGKCWSMPPNAERPAANQIIGTKPAQKPLHGDND